VSISKTLRFEVFKRDGFECQYCGNCPPGVVLEVDHITPKKLKGSDDIDNLITSCFDCNRGKGARDLKIAPQQIKEKLEIIKEREEQLREYNKLLQKIERRIKKNVNEVDVIYKSIFPKWQFSESFKNGAVKRFFKILPKQDVFDAMYLACNKMKDRHGEGGNDHAIKYFCGICWNRIRDKE